MDLTLPAYTEYPAEVQETQRLMGEIDRQAIQLQQLLQQSPRLKIQLTVTTIEYLLIEEERQIDDNNERLQESSRTRKIIREVKNCLQQNQPDPEYIIRLPIKENLEYYWQRYKEGDSHTRERIALWTHFILGKRLSQYRDELQNNNQISEATRKNRLRQVLGEVTRDKSIKYRLTSCLRVYQLFEKKPRLLIDMAPHISVAYINRLPQAKLNKLREDINECIDELIISQVLNS